MVDDCLQILVLIGAFSDHLAKGLAVLDALLCQLVLLLEPFFGHLSRPCLHLAKSKVMVLDVDLREVCADLHDVVVVGFVANLSVDFGKYVDPSFNERNRACVVCLNNLQLFVHFGDGGLNAIVLSDITIAHKELQCFLVLGVSKLENFNCVGLRSKRFDFRPLKLQ